MYLSSPEKRHLSTECFLKVTLTTKAVYIGFSDYL